MNLKIIFFASFVWHLNNMNWVEGGGEAGKSRKNRIVGGTDEEAGSRISEKAERRRKGQNF